MISSSPTLVGFFVCGMIIEFITSKMDLYDFFRFLMYEKTFLSYTYIPVMQRFDFGFFGFSSTPTILSSTISATVSISAVSVSAASPSLPYSVKDSNPPFFPIPVQ